MTMSSFLHIELMLLPLEAVWFDLLQRLEAVCQEGFYSTIDFIHGVVFALNPLPTQSNFIPSTNMPCLAWDSMLTSQPG